MSPLSHEIKSRTLRRFPGAQFPQLPPTKCELRHIHWANKCNTLHDDERLHDRWSTIWREIQMAEPVLRKGSTDPAVRDLQQALKVLGHDPGPINGALGDTTEAAVKAFQQEREITVDGIVGKITWLNIDEAD